LAVRSLGVDELRRLWNSEQLVVTQVERLGGSVKREPLVAEESNLLDPDKREFVSDLRVLRQRNLNQPDTDARGTSQSVRFAPYFRFLKRLSLDASQATDDDLRAISRLETLQRVVLYDAAKITDKGLDFLAKLEDLVELEIYGCQATSQGIAALQALPHLKVLRISSLQLDNRAVEAASQLQQLDQLALIGGTIDNSPLEKLASLPRLRHLDLSETLLGPSAIEVVSLFPHLEIFIARSTALTENDFERFRQNRNSRLSTNSR
jgi:Leucine-rich repeat (LRR) protein